ncbi:MAG TPA: DUF2336 domain-containing protein [Sphingomonas sp.]|nr:DUF2336 domain-containing protein [Sphingomonas sp.]
MADEDRLDDRTRAAFGALIESLFGTIRSEVAGHAARTLAAGGHEMIAEALLTTQRDDKRLAAILLADHSVLRELDGRVRQDLLADALVAHERDDSDQPSLLPRLAGERDPLIAGPAMAMLLALGRRATPLESGALARTDLSAETHHRFVWHVAADLREAVGRLANARTAMLDRALVAAAERSLAAHDEGIGLEPSAVKLASALGSAGRGGRAMAIEALGDRLLALFIALVAEDVGLDYDIARDAVLDRDGARLWLMLRAMGMDREAIGRIGLALATADRHRSLDDLAGDLDVAVATDLDAARAMLAIQSLPAAYRQAREAMESAR